MHSGLVLFMKHFLKQTIVLYISPSLLSQSFFFFIKFVLFCFSALTLYTLSTVGFSCDQIKVSHNNNKINIFIIYVHQSNACFLSFEACVAPQRCCNRAGNPGGSLGPPETVEIGDTM